MLDARDLDGQLGRRAAYVAYVAALLCAAPIAAQQPTSSPPPASPYAILAGVVADSIHGGPLVGAQVLVSGTDRSGVVDSVGRFRIDSIPPGDYELGVFHPLLDSLNVSVSSKNVSLRAGLVTTVIMATPSAVSVESAYCTEEERKRSLGAVVGRVLTVDGDDPIKDATVRYTGRNALVASGSQGKRELFTREVKVKPTGEFAICGLPLWDGVVRASRGDIATGEVTADVSKWLLAIVTLRLDTLKRGTAVVVGHIVDEKGAPVAHADIELANAHLQTTTSDSGTFALRDLPSGSQTIQIRKVGFQATDTSLVLSSKTPVQFDMRLRSAVVLSAVKVKAARDVALETVGFEQRKKIGIGHYLTEDDIQNRGAREFSDLMRTMPGLIVRQTRTSQQVILPGRGQMARCIAYMIDRVPFTDRPLGSIDDFVKPEDIIGVEVYQASESPGELTTAPSCMTIVIWTRASLAGT